MMGNLERQPEKSREPDGDFVPRHFYAAYVFDQAHERKGDIATLTASAATRLPDVLLVVV